MRIFMGDDIPARCFPSRPRLQKRRPTAPLGRYYAVVEHKHASSIRNSILKRLRAENTDVLKTLNVQTDVISNISFRDVSLVNFTETFFYPVNTFFRFKNTVTLRFKWFDTCDNVDSKCWGVKVVK